ncbi:hypothetical protein [Sphingomonas sp.]|uniref:hypothetical protein n=1 Tax=Sphingomonas sp. TaxID=28214 RepID=UPI003D6D254E
MITYRLTAAIAALAMTSACSAGAAGNERSGAEAIARADLYRQRAEACFGHPATDRANAPACHEALGLFHELGSTPTHFANEQVGARFFDAKSSGDYLLLRSVLGDLCDHPGSSGQQFNWCRFYQEAGDKYRFKPKASSN